MGGCLSVIIDQQYRAAPLGIHIADKSMVYA